ncbi:hypothetical protein GCM10010497_00040 [Streptomyces cinereoruber]|uniref:Uncharacterized protein n=1 Tax=Streptomyces cinereoruber TaxID=67260 RepID=A0AAV4KAJ7_9ACTN|nr:hypothetical protein GCM10010497_00040 [Streptomyces cinereoruber]
MRTSWPRPGGTVNEIAPHGPLQSKNPLRLVQVGSEGGSSVVPGRVASAVLVRGQQPPQL